MIVSYDQQLKNIYDHNRDENYFLLEDPNAKAAMIGSVDNDERAQT